MPEIAVVPEAYLPTIWQRVAPLIEAAMERNGLNSFQSVRDAVFSLKALLWVMHEEGKIIATLVTEIENTEWGSHCVLLAFGGDLSTAMPYLEKIEDYAHAAECKSLRLVGPEAWLKVLPADYSKTAAVIEKVL